MKYRKNVVVILLILCSGFLYNNNVLAQIPRSISIQGVLTNTLAIPNKQVIVQTTLHPKAEGSQYDFKQIDTVVIDTDGLFTITLGKDIGIPSSITFDKQYFVEFSINDKVMPMRIPLHSVPYALTSEKVADNSVEVQHLSEGLKSILKINEERESEKSENTLANYVFGFRAVIAGGDENRTSANYASILGGFTNTVNSAFGTVGGGQGNMSLGNWAFVGGGSSNRAMGTYSSVTAGNNNTASSSAMYGSIGGGNANQVGGMNATISGGQSNIATGTNAVISGGSSNRVMQDFATVSGGSGNSSTALGATIAGGMANTASGSNASINGGRDNSASGMNANIAGGMSNIASGLSSGISSGQSNMVSGSHSVISGGLNNKVQGMGSIISSGTNNTSSSNYSMIGGGSLHTNAGDFSTISGGGSNSITSTGIYATISGGQSNINQGRSSNISGGNSNSISQNSVRSVISGGDSNAITHSSSGNSNNSNISGGRRNTISNANFSTIAGGSLNSVNTGSEYAAIVNGLSNTISNGDYALIGGGELLSITGSTHSSIAGGQSNSISTVSHFSSISGGKSNTIGSNSGYSFIGSGLTNSIANTSPYSVIAGGNANSVTGSSSIIGGGEINAINGDGGSIIGGRNNVISSSAEYATIAGGRNNSVSANYAIAGGQGNTIGSGANTSVAMGMSNQISSNASFAVAIGNSNSVTGSQGITIGADNSAAANAIAIGIENQINASNAYVLGRGNVVNTQNEVVLGSFASTSSNPASTTNTSFIGNRTLTIGNGTADNQRKNAVTIFENGNTLVQGKMLVTDTTFLDNTKMKRLILETPLTASNLSGTNTGDVTIGSANGLSISGQVLSLSTATTTTAGAMSAADKAKLNSIATGAEVNVNADWNAVSGDAEILNKPVLGTMASKSASDYYTKTQIDAVFQEKFVSGGTHGQMLFNCNGALNWGPCLPIISTTAVTGVSDVQASSGGNISNEGGVPVTARGIVWSTNPNPTIALATKTVDGTGSGSFTSNINGLTRSTTYYVRAYATNSTGTSYGSEYSFTTLNTLQIGDAFQGGVIGYIFQPGETGYIEGETHGLIVTESDLSTKYPWGCSAVTINGADSYDDGEQNTIDIVNGCGTANIAARICYNLNLNGYTDWYLPSINELKKFYPNRVAIGGFALGFSTDSYWSSTEGNSGYSYAVTIRFSDGNGYNGTTVNTRGTALRVRPVRKF